jgi:hypothetical protein
MSQVSKRPELLLGIVYGINQAAAQGFGSPAVLVPVGIGALLLIVLVLHSKRTEEPALRLSLFQNKIFSVPACNCH